MNFILPAILGILFWGVIIFVIYQLVKKNKPPIVGDVSVVPVESVTIKKKIKFWQWLVIIVIVAWVIGYIRQQTPGGKNENELITAYSMAQVFVERNLKSPKSADFPTMNDPMVRILKEDRPNEYFVTGYVDSKNSFGVDVRTRYTIIMRYHPENDNWETLSLVFGKN
jgi:hypothetical protein